ncbi:heparinase II/III domain-containing protein [Sinomicrobium soli]|uniref:heparinase II/III domain-containing protein n=1 Tax=Sinomicrobium sp. N-1-3-6 TaxID=2219864 RepID=UPI001374B4F4|nr:heparinase II/III family protein [Sinomicrobium sp. N-1-3-6]
MKKTFLLRAGLLVMILMPLVFHAQPVSEKGPRLILSAGIAGAIDRDTEGNRLLDRSFRYAERKADEALRHAIEVPVPADPGGGYTHEKHKKNYADMYNAALVFAITGKPAHAEFVKKMLLRYAEVYPGLPLHPARKENHPAGKLFWQGLNEAVWLFYTIQAYDLVKTEIGRKDRETIENELFRKMAHFISVESYETFNKIHNHGTWAVAAVGMTGYVLGDRDMTERAIKGSDKDGKTGFLKQLDELFSPDGYYSEGPYYQRYAILPFMVFAEAIEENQPALEIFEYRDRLLHKAVVTLLQLTNSNNEFYPINDAIKDKTYFSEELVFATNIAYERYEDQSLLPVIRQTGRVSLSNAGYATALAAAGSKGTSYERSSRLISDGPSGKQGGIALLRMPDASGTLLDALFKFASQGMGHGHFDRLGLLLYDGPQEVLGDYGAARFLNVEAKDGGRYLKENKTYAKQSIAHNTLIADETSHYGGKVKQGSGSAPELLFCDLGEDIHMVSAREGRAYKDIELSRTVAMLATPEAPEHPFVIDIFRARSDTPHQYDLNFQYSGQLMDTSFEYTRDSVLAPLGTANGYQHLFKTAYGKPGAGRAVFTWLRDKRFYSITTLTDSSTELFFTQAGAGDPDFNLRPEKGYLVRQRDKRDHVFVSIIEPHGNFDPQLETVQHPGSGVEMLEVTYRDDKYLAVTFRFRNQQAHTLVICRDKVTGTPEHRVTIGSKTIRWKGAYTITQ